MKAIIKNPASNGYNYSREKELCAAYSIVCKGREMVCARSYMARSASASVVYASVWVHGEPYTSGIGKAGGYGYHKESQAFCDAIKSAGIELYGDVYSRARTPSETRTANKKRAFIGGVGESAMWEAFEAIARAAGARGKLTRVSHA